MSNEYVVEMKDITKKFGGLTAVDHVNFKVRSGEIHALCGENGAGKSTMLNAVAGTWAVDSGITTGSGDSTTFAPDNTCTRGEISGPCKSMA